MGYTKERVQGFNKIVEMLQIMLDQETFEVKISNVPKALDLQGILQDNIIGAGIDFHDNTAPGTLSFSTTYDVTFTLSPETVLKPLVYEVPKFTRTFDFGSL